MIRKGKLETTLRAFGIPENELWIMRLKTLKFKGDYEEEEDERLSVRIIPKKER